MSQGITVVSVAQLNAMATQVQGISKRITEGAQAVSYTHLTLPTSDLV